MKKYKIEKLMTRRYLDRKKIWSKYYSLFSI